MVDRRDVAIVGGGPAGLATAIVAAEQGLSVLVLERRGYPPDKACGEGILPAGVGALERLGITELLDPSSCRPFVGIRFIQEDGSAAESELPRSGLGIRRTALVEALTARARKLGAVIRHDCSVTRVVRKTARSVLETPDGPVTARLVVAADGLHSPLRHANGLDGRTCVHRRFAVRQHYHLRPWTNLVEVHLQRHGEAVATPVSAESVGVNYTWEDGLFDEPTLPSLASRFPALQEKLRGAEPSSTVKGAGPMGRSAKRRTADGLVLMGDAAGFVDSISGDGLSIAFNSALILGAQLPDILARGATRKSLAVYEREARRLFRGYWLVTHGLLWLARRPRARNATIHYLSRHERAFTAVMSTAMTMMVEAD